ncbi:hypothetical protein QYE76_047462 [Lolium multiflorum]|uniref:Uncharacterized protein n=1 Tax=Lolium multiflorum TaxID=4521 RepID=A0AAD8X081_LOLMU|nr:hypothetical protein QYE76_047462 [Lolium multiflorum]
MVTTSAFSDATSASKSSSGNFAPLITVRLSNDNYLYWRAQDAAIISAIMSTSIEHVQGLILFATTAQDAWAALAASFSSQSTARFMAVRGQLQDLKKLDITITNYFNKAQGLADTLTSIGEPLRPQEFIGYVLAGLDEDYDSVHDAISNRTTPITIRELYAQLLATEQRIEARKSELHGGRDFHSAKATGYSKGGKVPYRPSGDVRSDPLQQPRPVFTNKPPAGHVFHTGGGFPNRGGRGGGGYNTGGRSRHGDERGDRGGRPKDDNRPICQICDKVGHIASRCFKRFKTDYLGVDNDGRYMDRQVANATTSHGQTTAYNADAGWYMDTGATDHLTNRLDKLTMKEDYNGSDQVHAANGTGNGRGARLELLPVADVNHSDVDRVHASSGVPLHAGLGPVDLASPHTPSPAPASTRHQRPISPLPFDLSASPTDVYALFYSCRQCWASKSRGTHCRLDQAALAVTTTPSGHPTLALLLCRSVASPAPSRERANTTSDGRRSLTRCGGRRGRRRRR